MEDIWICPNCGNAMKKIQDENGVYRTCDKCGCTLDGNENHYEMTTICPNCHQEMLDSHECAHCGYDLGTDFY